MTACFVPRMEILPPAQRHLWPALRGMAEHGFVLYGGTLLARDAAGDEVKLSFFGSLRFGRIGQPRQTDDGVLILAALEDLLAHKLKVLPQRVEAKDYLDIAALLESGLDLASGLSAARLLFGANFQPSEALKAMTWFEGGDLHTLPDTVRKILVQQAARPLHLPSLTLQSETLL